MNSILDYFKDFPKLCLSSDTAQTDAGSREGWFLDGRK
jgi:hypothetical protein